MGTVLFDKYGRLKQHLHGTFADETDDGRLLYIPEITLRKAYHHQGVGCKAVQMLLEQMNDVLSFQTWCTLAGKPMPCLRLTLCRNAHSKQQPEFAGRCQHHLKCHHVLISVAVSSHPNLCSTCTVMRHEDCEHSWRSAGFRTINQTDYLGCVMCHTHPSWNQQEEDPEYVPWADNSWHEHPEHALLTAISAGKQMTRFTVLAKAFKVLLCCLLPFLLHFSSSEVLFSLAHDLC